MKDALPSPLKNGFFAGKATKYELCDCGCGKPKASYLSTGEICLEQTMALRIENLPASDRRTLARLEPYILVEHQPSGKKLLVVVQKAD